MPLQLFGARSFPKARYLLLGAERKSETFNRAIGRSCTGEGAVCRGVPLVRPNDRNSGVNVGRRAKEIVIKEIVVHNAHDQTQD
jgi:hypothetical protein